MFSWFELYVIQQLYKGRSKCYCLVWHCLWGLKGGIYGERGSLLWGQGSWVDEEVRISGLNGQQYYLGFRKWVWERENGYRPWISP